MPRLTFHLLDNFPYSRHAGAQTIRRGRAYYQDGRVWDVSMYSDQQASCLVDGDTGEYTVKIEIDKKSGQLTFDCDCYHADEGNFCKHMVAAGMEVSDYLRDQAEVDEEESELPISIPEEPSDDWKTKLIHSMALMPRQSGGENRTLRYAVAMILTPNRYGFSYYGNAQQFTYTLEPFIVKATTWAPLQELEFPTAENVNALLEKDKTWIKAGDTAHSALNPKGCINANEEEIAFIRLARNIGSIYANVGGHLNNYLSILSKLDIPIFFGSLRHPEKIEHRLHFQSGPICIQIDMQQDDKKLSLQAGFDNHGAFTHIKKKIETLTNNPTWVLIDDAIAQIENSHALEILSGFPVEIPNEQVDIFREQYFPLIAQALPIKSDLVKYQDIHADPIPRLYLQDDNKEKVLRATLQFGYGDYNSPLAKDEPHTLASVPDTWELVRIHRQPERENYFYQLLTDPIYRLKRAGSPHPHGTLELRARAHPYDFLMHSISALTQAGFEIYGEENLKTGRINRNPATLRVNITSGIDWFDLETFVAFGDQQVNFHDIRKALKRKENYIKLADGSIGQIPQEWLEKYKHLWGLAEETEDGFRVSDLHLSLLDQLLEENPSLQTPPDLIERRERFRHFERIAPHPLPKRFTGELRPYQKHGYDWLHFLREYKFGGILADDMGLGKTIQVLTYLQSLQEQAETSIAASLLVVPKSLIGNWQRESEKFTPSLKFLEYVGNFRNKDASIFDNYDVIITTYGTMLRDIELLREYKFNYVVLDESQAIKNPLAKISKAARLLNAAHRLVMTGTPVENNTFELWSQFAFLNPGLLGSMDYFKRQFSNPIESGGDEKSAELLRKLVYPFILRRTKEQVAIELPPRTERIVYTDMDATQKKLYNQTRERYRAELLGLIESEGMNNARFKVLEGLLRLRQIAIHPALVDKKYKGDAPKFEVLLEMLETLQAENHKALIFSQFVETLKLVKKELDVRKIKHMYLDGQTQKRQAKVDEFQNDPNISVFLISLKAGGVGLNLTAADYVIHLDPWWNPAVEMQASDRAHRIGQTRPVFVHKIIARDTVEEKILQLQENKRALVKNIIATEASFFKSLTQDDVKVLFD